MERLSLKEAFKKILRFAIFSSSCSMCNKEIDREGFLCSTCLKKLLNEAYLKNMGNFYYLYYYDESIRQIIADYKLRGRKALGVDLAFIVEKYLKKLIEDKKIDIVIPVPINEKRFKERGFNQVEYILEILKIKFLRIERVKNTTHMYSIENYDIRKKNVSKAFQSKLNLSNKKILLVDDIVTSGSTINEIIKEIRKKNENTDFVVFSVAISKRFKVEKIK